MTAIPRTFDDAMGANRGTVPLAFLRALAWSESSMNPTAQAPGSSAVGLFQILQWTLQDFERRHDFPGMDRTNPSDATALAVDLLDQMVRTYAARGLREDWSDPNFVGLVALGYKAGWSNVQGVAHVLGTLPRSAWTVGGVTSAASALFPKSRLWGSGGGGYMSDPALRRAVERVVDDYFSDLAPSDEAQAARSSPRLRGTISSIPPRAEPDGGGGGGWAALLLGTAAVVALMASKRR